MTRIGAMLVGVLLVTATSASAQVVLNPTKVIFTASADHAAMLGGQALVTRYEIRHFLLGASAPVSVEDLGKPTPDGANVITTTFGALPLSTTAQYIARVAAIGPTGEGVSAASVTTYFFAGPPRAGGVPAVAK